MKEQTLFIIAIFIAIGTISVDIFLSPDKETEICYNGAVYKKFLDVGYFLSVKDGKIEECKKETKWIR